MDWRWDGAGALMMTTYDHIYKGVNEVETVSNKMGPRIFGMKNPLVGKMPNAPAREYTGLTPYTYTISRTIMKSKFTP